MGENDSFRRGTPCYDGMRFTHLNDDFTLLVACYDVRVIVGKAGCLGGTSSRTKPRFDLKAAPIPASNILHKLR